MKRTYVRVRIAMQTPWRIGAWETQSQDSAETLTEPRDDVSLSRRPVIPGTSVAGDLRAFLGTEATRFLGSLPDGEPVISEPVISPWWVLGVRVTDAQIGNRHRVKIDRHRGAAADKGLFAVEEVTGGNVSVYFRTETSDPYPFLEDLKRWRPRFGGGQTTGMGHAQVTEICHRVLNLDDKDEVAELLELEPANLGGEKGDGRQDGKVLEPLEPDPAMARVDRLLKLGQTWFPDAKGTAVGLEPQPPLLTATVRCPYYALPDDGQTQTFGTAWKGLLRSRVQFIGRSLGMITCLDANEWTGCGTCGVCRAFGSTQRRGMWEFSNSPWLQADMMSRVEESKIKTYARIAIDRFTGGTRNGALFEQRYQPNLTMELKVVGPRLPGKHAWVERALLHAMRDLNDGLITLGGRGAIGFGMVTVQAVEFAGITVDFSRLDPVIERDAK